jgi:L-ascorbate metabolism protein UlaG (beta-lactamase superfamily)
MLSAKVPHRKATAPRHDFSWYKRHPRHCLTDEVERVLGGNAPCYVNEVILAESSPFVGAATAHELPLGGGLSAERQTDPAIDIDDLPPLDLILLSHFQGDHFDQIAQERLDKSVPIVTTPEAAGQLRELGFKKLYELETWETVAFEKGGARLEITAAPGRHGPRPASFVLPDVMGSVLRFQASGSGQRQTLYITGDTLIIDSCERSRGAIPIDLSMLHLGGTRVLGILVTMDDQQGVEALRIVQPKRAIPIHYDDYDTFKSPLADFRREVGIAGLADRVYYLGRGETYSFGT